MKFLYIFGIANFLALLGPNVAAQRLVAPPHFAPVLLEGLWKGKLAVAGGSQDLSFTVIALANGLYFASFTLPQQKLSQVAVEVRQPTGTDSVLLLAPQVGGRLLARHSPDGQQLKGLWCRQGLRTPVVLTAEPLPVAANAGPAPAPAYQEQDVLFPNYTARLQLAGTLTVPTGPGPFPAVVLVSDLGEQDRDGLAPSKEVLDPLTSLMSYRLLGSLANNLTRHGVVVLRFDDRGVGQSEGTNAAATPAQRAGDVQAALNFMRTRPEVDLLHLGVLGHGEGANVALLVAAQPLAPAFVVGLGAYGLPGTETLLTQQAALLRARNTPPAQLALRLRRQQALYELVRYPTNLKQTQAIALNLLRQAEPGLAPPAAQAQAVALLTPWSRAFLAFNPLDDLEAVQCPVLLLTGKLDEQAPPAQHLAALAHRLRSNGNHEVTARQLPRVNHLLQPPQLEWIMLNGEMKPVLADVVQKTLNQWLVAQLKR